MTYSIESNAATAVLFNINPTTGEISAIGDLDRDPPNGQTQFEFTVVVVDEPSSTPNYKGYAKVVVEPRDKNDLPPVFVQDSLQGKVREGPADNQGTSLFWIYCIFNINI